MLLKAREQKKRRAAHSAKVLSNSDIDPHKQKRKVKKKANKEKKAQQPELARKVEEKKSNNPNPPNNYQFILLSLKIAELAAGITFLLCVICGFAAPAGGGPTSSFPSPAYLLNESST
jgi:hypothetical protein